MTGLPFCVHAWSAWAPGRESEGAWRSWAGQASDDRPDTPPEPAPLLLRRRVSALGQKLLKAAWSLPEAASARIVLCSRHGEFGRTLSILDALASRTEISPADFTLSVHNALAGLLSIARANRGGHTCIAAGDESFGFGMLEALACLAERPEEPVLLLYFDEQLPAPFEAFDPDAPAPIALALHLTADAGERFRLATLPALAEPAGEPGAIAFLRVLLGAATASVTNGEQLLWQWRRDDAAA